ncbi:histidine kinase [Nostoc sp. CENA543]|uniref:trifunctional serine/threonine-protein kinase/ATP-binding protein/sensor histidine kinase n=1 Tax=Nostoc sp. CENA543 TaxID=1869241 RepID=UPI000CA0D88E|nr:trifunctional serine/threonine-protein kinase/ATP-binding protein/sensor histidine kinase [Nostoc sp. CENA543]AUT01062.1 histidine kinase [Nostoc sp. CENA543]
MVSAVASILGYRIIEELYSGSRTQVYRAVRESDLVPVAIKLLKNPFPSFHEILSFRNQYTIAKNLHSPSIIQTYSLEPFQNGYILVMEDFGGISLNDYFAQNQSSAFLKEFLMIAIALCDTLNILYRERIIHKDIKPSNILINPETKQVKLIDFSIASLLPRETQTLVNPNVLEGTLAYISPEQTGRMNRGIDYRTDFYSLGVTFYELLTGELPFASNDPMELVHSHLAKIPEKLSNPKTQLPSVLGEIVLKLMAKNAEDRYQSALGLKFDLENCLQQLETTGGITSFEIATRDVCDRFIMPDKLYGREAEVKTLLAAFDRVSQGETEMMLVAGFSGIGKTAVVNEVHKPIVRQRGYFIKGKYDQFGRNIPFSAFVQAFRDLMTQLLTESDVQIGQWKTKILNAIGENGQVIIEVIPELSKIIGEQPLAVELSGTAAQNRFNLLFHKFTQVFASAEHPLVMFLDDLQWADSASLNLIQLLMVDTSHLFIIGAYRDNEVSPGHPLMLTLGEITKKQATINTITLLPLTQEQVNKLVADTLKCTENLAWNLSVLLYQKTQGNPFFVTQFLKALYQDGLIRFSPSGGWECDIAQVATQAVTDDIVAFMSFQLRKLPLSTQQVIKLAACIGNSFDLATLAIVSEQSEIETASALWKALQEGLILPISEVYKFYQQESSVKGNLSFVEEVQPGQMTVEYKFLHDRVQQAAYSLIPPQEIQSVHLKIGQLLLNNTPAANLEDGIFAIVNQLNLAKELLTQSTERQALAEYNLLASRKAKIATAYVAAFQYAQKGIDVLAEDSWQTQYHLTLELHQIAAETSHLIGDLQQMQAFTDLVLDHAKTPLDMVSVYGVIIDAFTTQAQITDAIAAAINILGQLQVELPSEPSQADVTAAFDAVAHVLEGHSPAELLNLPSVTDNNILAAARILTSLAPAAYLSQPLLYLVVILKKVYLSVVYGNESTSPFTYASYGILLCGIVGNLELGYEFGQLALDLLYRDPNSQFKGKTLTLVYLYTRHGKTHLRETLQPLQHAYSSCLDAGDLAFTGYCAYNYVLYSHFAGQNLTQLELESDAYCQALAHLKQNLTHTYCLLARQIILNLTGYADNPVVLSGTAYNEQQQLPLHEAASDRTGLALLWINKLIVSYLFAEFAPAVQQAQQARQYLDAVMAFVYVPIFHFYESLAQLAVFEQLSVPEQQQIEERIASNQEILKYWATHAPINFQHKYDLVAAEWYRVLGNRKEAMEFYDCAIALAKANGYIQEESLANELAAKFYLDWGKKRMAEEYMIQAYYGYACWGAKAKVADLERRYPQLLAPIFEQTQSPISTNETIFALGNSTSTSTSSHPSSSSSVSTSLDLGVIFKAYQTISSEIELEKLLSVLLSIVIKNAGSDRCVFMMPQSDQLQIQALAKLSGNNIDFYPMLLNPQPVEDSVDVPVGLIHTVKRSLKPIVIVDARVHPQFINDPYIQQQQPKSILCSPILYQGKLRGILYLENSLVTGAFTSDRVELLNLLCTQAAISLENARLYENSQNYAQKLTQSLTQLQANEIRFQNLANNIPGMVYQFHLAADGSTSTPYVSSGCWDLYELDPELVMAGIHNLYTMHHPDDHAAMVEALTDSAQNLTPFRQECRLVLPSGKVKWVQFASRPTRRADGVTVWDGVVIDISERKQAEKSFRLTQFAIDRSSVPIWWVKPSGKISYVNDAACHDLGYSRTEILQRYVWDFNPELSSEIWEKHWQELKQKGSFVFEADNFNKSGHSYPVEVTVNYLELEGEEYNCAFVKNISDRKQAELALQQAQLQIIQSEKMSALGNLVAGVAHEMNNPLGFIAASIKQAQPTVADIFAHLKLYQETFPNKSAEIADHAESIDLEYSLEDLPKMLDSMTLACNRLKNISTSLRTFSRADRDYKVPFNIHEGIDSTILILKHRLKANEQRPAIAVVTNYGNLPPIECFPGQLNQVFMNILANAIDALEESNLGRNMADIQASPNRITISTELENNLVKIVIADNAKGMSEEIKQKIFDNLFTTKAVGKGTGLGLAIARQIVEETHGGKLSCKSVLGEGTEFLIEIPV